MTSINPTPDPTSRRLSRTFGIAVPTTWRRRSDPDHGVLVSARATQLPPSGVRPELVLRYARVSDDLLRWREKAMDELAERLIDFALEDDYEYDLREQLVAYRRFAHRLGAADVVGEQWAWLAAEVGVTLTCSVAREEYADYCDVFEAIAESVDLLSDAA